MSFVIWTKSNTGDISLSIGTLRIAKQLGRPGEKIIWNPKIPDP